MVGDNRGGRVRGVAFRAFHVVLVGIFSARACGNGESLCAMRSNCDRPRRQGRKKRYIPTLSRAVKSIYSTQLDSLASPMGGGCQSRIVCSSGGPPKEMELVDR
ncbi:hypothetical protein ETAA8_19110 [Anatilimnocola aggregata]|uniref:Uncharacterized protein n=1 Tax=Anatilimnocola aggregata TaxID=2528021 RepID=A0A517Y9B9_9BACT|nr:hypothetical protein ETAA8_19110 [Anatilimnocola aggregata]